MSKATQWKAMTVMTVDGFGYAMAKSSQIFLIEQALCRDFYTISDPDVILPDGSVPETLCKTENLQSQVALLSNTLDFTLLIASTRSSLILFLNDPAIYFHTFTDIRWVLLLWVLELVGGGMPVREVLLWMYMAESVPEDGLTGAFNILSSILIGMMSVGTFMGSLLLRHHVWVLCSLVICVCALVILLICLLPNHHKSLYPEEHNILAEEGVHRSSDSPPTSPATSLLGGEEGLITSSSRPSLWRSVLRASTVDLYLSLQLILQALRNPLTLRVMSMFFTYTLAGTVTGTSQQWASSTFNAPLASVEKIISMEQIISAVQLLILPLVSKHVLRPRLRGKQATDLWVIVA
ncbi:hypothetical protein FQN49_007538, partial [Arthroderma sp. PD_2]